MNKINCDFCDNDLTNSGSIPKYRLVLKSEKISHGGVVKAVIPDKIIDMDYYFCNLKCLKNWINES